RPARLLALPCSSNANNPGSIPIHCHSCRTTQGRSACGSLRSRFDSCETLHSCLTASHRMFQTRLRLFPRFALHTPTRLRLVNGSACPFVLTTSRQTHAHPPTIR